ncbi:hypothetical protein ACF06V_35435 [Streptomyces bobili]
MSAAGDRLQDTARRAAPALPDEAQITERLRHWAALPARRRRG